MAPLHVWFVVLCYSAAAVNGQVTEPTDTSSGTSCAALQQIASGSPICSTDSSCSQLHCTAASATIDFRIQPCTNPPSVQVVIIRNGGVVFSRTFSHSEAVPVTFSGSTFAQLNVTLVQSPNLDAITLKVDFIPQLLGFPSTPINVIPMTRIPIDRSHCNATVVPTLPSPTPSPRPTSGPPPNSETCQALETIASNALIPCHTSLSCTAVDCTGVGYNARMIILSCNNPPAVDVILWEANGDVVFNETLTRTRSEPVEYGGISATITVHVEHVTTPQDAIIVSVSIAAGSIGNTVLIPETTIPIDRSNCTSLILPTPTATPQAVTPTTEPTSSTCQALNQIASTGSTCHTSSSCESLICDLVLGSTNLTILPCHTPPAVAVQVAQTDGTVILDDVITRSRLENITLGGTPVGKLNISVQHDNDALILKVDAILPLGNTINVIPSTRIPLDRCSCPNITCSITAPPRPTPTPSATPTPRTTPTAPPRTTAYTSQTTTKQSITSSSSSQSSTSQGSSGTQSYTENPGKSTNVPSPGKTSTPMPSSSTAIAGTGPGPTSPSKRSIVIVAVPAAVGAIILVAILVVVMVVGLVFIYKKRAKAFSFQRMTFSSINDEEEDEDD